MVAASQGKQVNKCALNQTSAILHGKKPFAWIAVTHAFYNAERKSMHLAVRLLFFSSVFKLFSGNAQWHHFDIMNEWNKSPSSTTTTKIFLRANDKITLQFSLFSTACLKWLNRNPCRIYSECWNFVHTKSIEISKQNANKSWPIWLCHNVSKCMSNWFDLIKWNQIIFLRFSWLNNDFKSVFDSFILWPIIKKKSEISKMRKKWAWIKGNSRPQLNFQSKSISLKIARKLLFAEEFRCEWHFPRHKHKIILY